MASEVATTQSARPGEIELVNQFGIVKSAARG